MRFISYKTYFPGAPAVWGAAKLWHNIPFIRYTFFDTFILNTLMPIRNPECKSPRLIPMLPIVRRMTKR
jgi:hypothetical protein